MRTLKILAYLFCLIGGVLVGFGTYSLILINDSNLTINICLLAGGAVLIFVGFLLEMFAKKKLSDRCKKCKTSLKGCAYEWVLISLYDTYARDEELASQIASYEITATCPKCGEKRTFKKEFTATDYRTRQQNNTEKLIEDWCKQKFGH